MLKLRHKDFRDYAFQQAWQKVMQTRGWKDMRITSNLVRINKLIESYAKQTQDNFNALLRSFARLDEKGNFIPKVVNGEPLENSFDIPEERRGEWQKALETFEQTEVELIAKPIHLHDLVPCNLSADELSALEPFITDLAVPVDAEVARGGKVSSIIRP